MKCFLIHSCLLLSVKNIFYYFLFIFLILLRNSTKIVTCFESLSFSLLRRSFNRIYLTSYIFEFCAFFILEYHVAWLRNGTIRLTNCLQTQPHWMAKRRNILGSLPMSRVFLPGTHDSASYAIHERANSENIVEKFVITQVNL